MNCALCNPDKIHLDRGGPNIYDMVNALCAKHKVQWEKWELKCGTPCYLSQENGVLISGSCVSKCRLTAVKAFFKEQANYGCDSIGEE